MATKAQVIDIKPINIQTIDFTLRGLTPLIVHAWGHKAKQEMLDKQRKVKTSAKHDAKIPMNDFMESLYWLTEQPTLGKTDEEAEEIWDKAVLDGAKFGFPVTGIKQAIITGAYRAGLDVKMTELRGLMFMVGNTEASTTNIAEIVGTTPSMREDMVKVGGMSKTADIRYRPEFEQWEIPITMRYHSDGKYSIDQLLNLVNYGGMYCGIGEWRPERDGQSGMFELIC
jgi:hypothetical protein